MASQPSLRVRRSIADIQNDYDNGNTAELEALMRAFKWIKELAPNDPNSFFQIGGFHGEPFRGEGETDPAWWGGYCQHATVLFPSWHRAYMLRIEDALRSAPGCESVTLPFWDETSNDSVSSGIPSCLTDEFFTLDGVQIPNPLRSFTLPMAIVDQVQGDNQLYSKPQGYETVRYPLSGLVGTPEWQQETQAHNALFPTAGEQNAALDKNIIAWLTTQITFPQGGSQPPITTGLLRNKFARCLNAPTYTLFSNTTSKNNWNANKSNPPVEALEDAHNMMHLAVGGFDVPNQGNFSQIRGANGDMGENDTAALDPIFFFHHCFIDYVFWTWQRRHGTTGGFDIDQSDPGARYDPPNSLPPAGGSPDDQLSMTTPLDPFTASNGAMMTTADVIDIENQLGYTYGPGSLDAFAVAPHEAMLAANAELTEKRRAHIANINRANIRGSFLIATWANGASADERKLLDITPVLSRWHLEGCANCQTRLGVTADVVLPDDVESVSVELHTRDALIGQHDRSNKSAGVLEEGLSLSAKDVPFTVEIR